MVTSLGSSGRLERSRDDLVALIRASRVPLLVYSYTLPAPSQVEALNELGIPWYLATRGVTDALHALARRGGGAGCQASGRGRPLRICPCSRFRRSDFSVKGTLPWWGSNGLSASFPAMEKLYLAGCPWVACPIPGDGCQVFIAIKPISRPLERPGPASMAAYGKQPHAAGAPLNGEEGSNGVEARRRAGVRLFRGPAGPAYQNHQAEGDEQADHDLGVRRSPRSARSGRPGGRPGSPCRSRRVRPFGKMSGSGGSLARRGVRHD